MLELPDNEFTQLSQERFNRATMSTLEKKKNKSLRETKPITEKYNNQFLKT